MSVEFINFRDKGCQGAKQILKEALCLANHTSACTDSLVQTQEIYVFISPNNTQLPFFKEAALLLGFELKIYTEPTYTEFSEKPCLCFVEESMIPHVKKENFPQGYFIYTSNTYSLSSPYPLDMFISIVYHCLKYNKQPHELSVAWIGDCQDKYKNFTHNLIESCICLNSELSLAFPENPIASPEPNILDLALRAGAKVFLTYDIDLISPPHILYIGNWTYFDSSSIKPQHPFLTFGKKEEFSNTSLISLQKEFVSSSIDQQLYSQAAVYTLVATFGYFLQIN